MQPIDEGREYQKYHDKLVRQAKWEVMARESNDQKVKLALRRKIREEKRERAIASCKRPERDLLEMSTSSQHYRIHMDNQI